MGEEEIKETLNKHRRWKLHRWSWGRDLGGSDRALCVFLAQQPNQLLYFWRWRPGGRLLKWVVITLKRNQIRCLCHLAMLGEWLLWNQAMYTNWERKAKVVSLKKLNFGLECKEYASLYWSFCKNGSLCLVYLLYCSTRGEHALVNTEVQNLVSAFQAFVSLVKSPSISHIRVLWTWQSVVLLIANIP